MKKNKLFKNLFIVLLIIWLTILIKQQFNISKYKSDLNVLASKMEKAEDDLKSNQKKLNEEEKNLNSTEYIEKLAREKLGMYLESEKVYIDSTR